MRSRSLTPLAVLVAIVLGAIGRCTPPDPQPPSPTTTSTTSTSTVVDLAGARRARTQPDLMPLAAVDGEPRIEQVRDGSVVATFTSLGYGGPFQRSHAFHSMEPGDVFLVYPAVYSGAGQFPWIGPRAGSDADWNAGILHAPTDITIRGVTVDGRRPVIRLNGEGDYNVLGHAPVEIEGVDGLLVENIDIDGNGFGTFDRSGIYIVGSRDVTLRNMRIHGFQGGQHNGVFAAGANSGTLLLDDVRLYDNGGWDGPAHNAYINESTIDPDFTVELRNSFSSAVNVGHLFKSRAQVTVLDGNLLEGIDVPAGWATRDSFGHLNIPMTFFTPNLVPGSVDWPADTPVVVELNRFEGFATAGEDAAAHYRGTDAVDVPA